MSSPATRAASDPSEALTPPLRRGESRLDATRSRPHRRRGWPGEAPTIDGVNTAAPEELDAETQTLAGERVHLVGSFASLGRREVGAAVSRRGGVLDALAPTLVVVGEDSTPEQHAEADRFACDAGATLCEETDLWARLGLLPGNINDPGVHRLYTPAMVASVTGTPLAALRRWTRRGWLKPACRVHRLAYFRFEELRAAQVLTELLDAGRSLTEIDHAVDSLRRSWTNARSLSELPIEADGGRLVVRSGEHVADPIGQRLLGFDVAFEDEVEPHDKVLPFGDPGDPIEAEAPREVAWRHAEAGVLSGAIEAWRLAMLESQPVADDHFTLASWLHEAGQLGAARERYYAVLELDPYHAEARVDLGRVLSELGELDLAIAAFRGALEQHAGFADAHYHLAKALDRRGEAAAADVHWRRLLELIPDGPWASEAEERVGSGAP